MSNLKIYKESHKRYLSNLGSSNLFSSITEFLLDPEVSAIDELDHEFLFDLFFINQIKHHIGYAVNTIDLAVKNKDADNKYIKALAKLSNFYEFRSLLYQEDLLFEFKGMYTDNLLESYFNYLRPNMKIHFISYYSKNYPHVLKGSKRFKTYLVFS